VTSRSGYAFLSPRANRSASEDASANQTHRARREVAWREQLREPEAVGAGDLEAALDRHVPERDAVEEGVELRLERVEADREVHVVVDREALWAVALRGLVVRRPAVAGAALHPAHVERLGHLGSSPVAAPVPARERPLSCERRTWAGNDAA